MNRVLDKDIREIHNLLVEGKVTPRDLVNEVYERIEERKSLNAFITLNKTDALECADKLLEEGVDKDNLLWGIPIAIKDNISTCGLRTTCASKMLDNYVPIFDATAVEKIKNKKMIIIGKTNMDEFANGATSRTSYYGAPKNPIDEERIAGGSSGGNASSIGAGIVPLALGSDTGGSIRQPASYCGIVGMKPTYGSVSRYGLIAYASSLDQIGPMTRTVYENALLLNSIVGHDTKDLTSSPKEVEDYTRFIGKDIKGMKIAVPKYYVSEVVDKEILDKVTKTVDFLKENGASVDYIDMKYLDQAVTLFQIIAMSEMSSNLARFDGIRYGYRSDNSNTVEEMYKNSRSEAFGPELKRRIMVGSFLLSGDNAKIYYEKALKIRKAMALEFDKVFKQYDFIIGPTTTVTAYKLDEGLNDPTKSFMDDVLIVPVNMAGLPAMSLPIGVDSKSLPIGLHIIGNRFDEARMYGFASFLEGKIK